jgi:phosphoribosylamine--glycine ligase
MSIMVIGAGASAFAVAQRLEHETGDEDLWLIDWDHLLTPGCPDPDFWHQRIAAAAGEDGIDLAVVLDRQPLADGIADVLSKAGLTCFGPGAAAAAITTSAAHTRELLAAAGLQAGASTAGSRPGTSAPESRTEQVVWAFCDGMHARIWPALRHYTRAHDGDRGPATAGMGAATVPTRAETRALAQQAADAVIASLRERGIDYRGLLTLTIGDTATGPVVLALDTHWGDPDTQALLSVLEEPLLPLLVDAAAGNYGASTPIPATGDHAVWVTLADHDYPRSPRLWNLEALPAGTVYRYQAASEPHEPERRFSIGATGTTVQAARQEAYARIGQFTARFTGPVPVRWRTDIGADIIQETRT